MDGTNISMVSVVLITYNSARYVIEALESIKAQTWENIELIISDDGSTDDTVQLCWDWLKENKDRFPNAKLITVTNNTGIPANCNRGLRQVNGDWIKIISGDDILLNNFIADNIEYAEQFPDASFIISDIREIDENGVLIREKVINEALLFFSGMPTAKKQLKAYTRWPTFLNTPTFFFKRELIEKMDYCDEEFKIYEDMTMVIRAMERGVKLYYMGKPTVAYRIHRNSISRNLKIDALREKEAFMVFRKYQMQHLNPFSPLDLSVYYETWLRFKYKGFRGRKGGTLLRKLSLFYWYMRFNGIKTY